MIEKFLVTSELNGTELLRSMALRGKDSFAFRVMPSVDLAETALIRCGKMPAVNRVRLNEQQFVMGDLMRRVDYFTRASSFQDAVNLTDTLNSIRMRLVDGESESMHELLPRGEFADKNAALLRVYDLYMCWLAENGRMDEVCLIRYAVEQADAIDAEFLVLEGFNMTPLETSLVKRVSGGQFRTVSLQELFGGQLSDTLRLDSLTEAYGPVNEVDRLIKDVYDSGVPLDRCTVAVTDTAVYGQLFYDMAMEKGVPIAFGCGISVSNTRPAGLLSLWKNWNETGFHGVDALYAMVFSDAFNRSVLMELLSQGRTEEEGKLSIHHLTDLVNLAGSMRLEPNAQINARRIEAWENTLSESAEERKLVEPLRRFGQELGLSCDQFLDKYASIRKHSVGGPLDNSAKNVILDVLRLSKQYPDVVSMEDMIPTALEQTVGNEPAQPGKLLVTTITGALSAQREHLYILGLSADKFPGKPRENALMLDSDWELLPFPETAPISWRLVEGILKRLTVLISLAHALNTDVHVYWPDYDPASLKDLIPSSVIYFLRDAFPDVRTEKAGYFPAVYSEAYAIGRLYLNDGMLPPAVELRELEADGSVNPEQREWAPAAIDTWFGCKRQFLYQYILHLNVQEEDDPLVIISPREFGTLAHHMMEILAERHPDEATFHAMASDMFEDYLITRPPMDPNAAEREKDRFVCMMDAARRDDPGREVVLMEQYLHSVHPGGLKLTGRLDRVETDGTGKYIVVDFKTGRKVLQDQDDPRSCRQILIYAWMLQQSNMPTAYCEYRYLQRSQSVSCETNPIIMGQLEEDLIRFYDGLKTGDFAPEDGYGAACDKKLCRRCPYAGICVADNQREEARE